MTGDLAELAKGQLRRRVRMWVLGALVPFILTMIGWAVAGFLALLLVLAPVLMALNVVNGAGRVVTKTLADLEKGIGSIGCIVNGTCDATPGASAPSMDATAAELVTTQWLPQETAAVSYYCARVRGRPCVNVAFVQAIMMQESGGDVLAGSSAGAEGLMQVEPSHFAPGQNPFDPATNIMVGVGFLDQLDAEFGGNLPLVAAGYNAGPGAPEDWITTFHTSNWSVLSQEPEVQSWGANQGTTTEEYVNYVMAYYTQFSLVASPRAVPGHGVA